MTPEDDALVSISAEGDVQVKAGSVQEAKVALKQLKLKKKEVNLARKEITNQQRMLRAEYTDANRRRGSMMHGGGAVGRLVRSVQRGTRDASKKRLADALAPLERRKYDLDALIGRIDEAILRVEEYIIQNST